MKNYSSNSGHSYCGVHSRGLKRMLEIMWHKNLFIRRSLYEYISKFLERTAWKKINTNLMFLFNINFVFFLQCSPWKIWIYFHMYSYKRESRQNWNKIYFNHFLFKNESGGLSAQIHLYSPRLHRSRGQQAAATAGHCRRPHAHHLLCWPRPPQGLILGVMLKIMLGLFFLLGLIFGETWLLW